MVEEFRQPLIDTFTLKLANLEIFTENDFMQMPDAGLNLNDEEFKEYLALYESKLNEKVYSGEQDAKSWRELFQYQGRQFEKSILENKQYRPFTMEKGGFKGDSGSS